MSFAGVLVNVATVLIGGLFGLLFKKAIPQRVTTAVMIGLGLCTLYIGIDGSMACHNILIVIAAMVLGGITGRIGVYLEEYGKHPMPIRRYYRKLDY